MIEMHRGPRRTDVKTFDVQIATRLIMHELLCGSYIIDMRTGTRKSRLSLSSNLANSIEFRLHFTGPPEEMETVISAAIETGLRRSFGSHAIKAVKRHISTQQAE